MPTTSVARPVSPTEATSSPDWVLRGAVSNQRYTTAAELTRLNAQSPALGRPDATVASLIPITKSNAWWELAQDERRAIFEETSHHIRRAMDYLPAVARKLHHCRDLGGPFDFLTWFEFAPSTRPHSTIYWLSCGGRRNGPLSSARSRCA